MATILVLLGSNTPPYDSISAAFEQLMLIDPSLVALPAEETPAIGGGSMLPFRNQLIRLETILPVDQIKATLKAIEINISSNRSSAEVPIDIDLLTYDEVVLKSKEMTIPYVCDGVKRLLGDKLLKY